jgi:3-hydroxyisobutyrate dehydrogenase-like beta-hydroxyacid dehydrogenase
MCKNIIEKGNLTSPLVVFNRSIKRAEEFQSTMAQGTVKVASSIAEAVSEADIIFTCLGDDASVRETITAAMKVNVTGKVFVDSTTIHPDTTDELAKVIEAHGAGFVACPGMNPFFNSIIRSRLTEPA